MRGKILFAAGLAVGYVLGTRAGRERYEQMASAARSFWNDPRVQRRVDQVEDFVKERSPEVADFFSDGAKKVVGQVTRRGSAKKTAASSASSSGSSSASTTAKKPTASAAKKPAAKSSGAAGSGSTS